MAGYSGTPLPRKLGIAPGARIALVAAPRGARVLIEPLPVGATVASGLRGTAPLDVIVAFATRLAEVEAGFAAWAARLTPAGGLWIAWPKRASDVATDCDENAIRAIGLAAGLVDNKVCAIDATWSGLRFVRRLRDR